MVLVVGQVRIQMNVGNKVAVQENVHKQNDSHELDGVKIKHE